MKARRSSEGMRINVDGFSDTCSDTLRAGSQSMRPRLRKCRPPAHDHGTRTVCRNEADPVGGQYAGCASPVKEEDSLGVERRLSF